MAKFLFIYRESTESRPQPSPEEMQALQAANERSYEERIHAPGIH